MEEFKDWLHYNRVAIIIFLVIAGGIGWFAIKADKFNNSQTSKVIESIRSEQVVTKGQQVSVKTVEPVKTAVGTDKDF